MVMSEIILNSFFFFCEVKILCEILVAFVCPVIRSLSYFSFHFDPFSSFSFPKK